MAPRSIIRALSVAALALTLSAAVSAPALAATPTWSIQPTPSPLGPVASNVLSDVSCPSTGSCTAVGFSVVGVALTTLAERWSRGKWTVQPTVAPSTAQLSGVSCSSAQACIAVGDYIASGASGPAAFPLVERWNGLAWTLQRTPLRALPNGGNLLGVSCTSASACTAVGLANTGGTLVPLVERWNGLAWRIQPSPAPAGASSGYLRDVSCTSATSCTAVGTYEIVAGDDLTFAEHWDGTSWTIQPTVNPGGANYLLRVSCTSASSCMAVGFDEGLRGFVTLAERWDGTSWTVLPTPNPSGQTAADLNAVSCVSASACTAVGDANDPGVSAPTSFAEQWDGSVWTLQPVPTPAQAAGDQLMGVSCPAASVCTAVGVSYNHQNTDDTLAERYS